jgi:ATP-dependent DNA helicase PIF1
MPATSRANASKPSSSKKRKSEGDSCRPTKQSKKLDSYFPQLYPVSSNPKESESQPVPLNDEQKRVLEVVVDEGKNVFFTGAAGMYVAHPHSRHLPYLSHLRRPGTGKSLLLRAIIATLKKKHAKKPAVVSVTASTGMAASNIGGTAFHSSSARIHLEPSTASLTQYGSTTESITPCSAGMTIHSWGAVTPGQNDLDKQVRRIRTCKPALNRWKTTKVLIVDEGKYLFPSSP